KDHSLHSAQEWAKLILSQGISDNAFERHIV
ncbi:S-ribosylhomocysteine lyase, partial [Streptococcus agalactiae]|nr:S-ribosylhomocysteine lyase [Streptococcus agalactiae]MCD0024426.1 S-ribosylhomocysteine lyase [Streptococcus agalactiae]MCD0025953.1 S-ribosylhomocysteine lyase [Streptococcus agalactiae]